jgi:outer membrane immunogenic protein
MTSSVLAVCAAALALAAAAAPASAQGVYGPPATSQTDNTATHYWYGMFGFTDHEVYSSDLDTVDGRLGARWGWFGIEGEAGLGVNHHRIGNGTRTGVTGVKPNTAGIDNQQTIYGVGYLPLGRGIDLFARVGYGRTDFDFKGMTHPARDDNTNINAGGGGQWFWDGTDGIRAEYTREDFNHAQSADSWSVSYVRKF